MSKKPTINPATRKIAAIFPDWPCIDLKLKRKEAIMKSTLIMMKRAQVCKSLKLEIIIVPLG